MNKRYKTCLIGGAIDDEPDLYEYLKQQVKALRTFHGISLDDGYQNAPLKVASITSAEKNYATGVAKFAKKHKPTFEAHGFDIHHVTAHIDNYKTHTDLTTQKGQRNANLLQEADIIYFHGGNQVRYARTWLNDDGSYNALMKIIVNQLKAGTLIAGASAGATIQGALMFGKGLYDRGTGSNYGIMYFNKVGLASKTIADGGISGSDFTDRRPNTNTLEGQMQFCQNGGVMPGFGLLPDYILIDTHFGERARLGRLISAMQSTRCAIGIGIDESGGCVTIDSDYAKKPPSFQAFAAGGGGVYIISWTKHTVYHYDQQGFLYLKGLRLDYVSEGDRFDYDYHEGITIHSAKHHTVRPSRSEPLTKQDLLKPYEVFRLMVNLIEQKNVRSYNTARLTTHSSKDLYPQQVDFHFSFYQNRNTFGFYNQQSRYQDSELKIDSITIQNVNIDIMPVYLGRHTPLSDNHNENESTFL